MEGNSERLNEIRKTLADTILLARGTENQALLDSLINFLMEELQPFLVTDEMLKQLETIDYLEKENKSLVDLNNKLSLEAEKAEKLSKRVADLERDNNILTGSNQEIKFENKQLLGQNYDKDREIEEKKKEIGKLKKVYDEKKVLQERLGESKRRIDKLEDAMNRINKIIDDTI